MITRILFYGAICLSPALLGGCSGGDSEPGSVVVDSLDIDMMVDVQLAEARAELTGEPVDSLRDEAMRVNGVDSLDLQALLTEYAGDPERAAVLYEKAAEGLDAERRARSILEE